MKRLSPEALEALAAESGKPIEHDPDTGQMYVTVNRTEYVAQLPARDGAGT